ncbi:hypothetical protein C0J52_10039, partial [Blattella germanica]
RKGRESSVTWCADPGEGRRGTKTGASPPFWGTPLQSVSGRGNSTTNQMMMALVLLVLVTAASSTPLQEEAGGGGGGADFWMRYGDSRLRKSLETEPVVGRAKNVVVFVGDGMGMATVTAARIYKGQRAGRSGEEHRLSWELFPTVGLSKTYNVDKQVPDSAGTATALFTGVKSKYYMLGLDSRAPFGDCDPRVNERARLASIMQWAQDAGKHTGLVTTTRVTHATPAALYAHSNHRDWECDSEIPFRLRDCVKDIARQLVEDGPGKHFKVVLGGGQRQFGIPLTAEYDPDDDSCNRTDDLNLLPEWLRGKRNAVFVNDTGSLRAVDAASVEHLLGLFSPGHMPYALERDQGPQGSPSLLDMTAKALQVLSKAESGFVLMVEGGRIDHGHHANYARMAMHETSELDDAVAHVAALTDPRDTLLVVTADHSHAFTINGYPKRGNDILGFANKSAAEGLYETLTYANGPGFDTHRGDGGNGSLWRRATQEERQSPRYRHFAPFYLEDETHGGEDVPVYSRGPSAHLLSGTFEENYVAHVVGYAACIGPPSKLCTARDRVGMLQGQPIPTASTASALGPLGLLLVLLSLLLLHAT